MKNLSTEARVAIDRVVQILNTFRDINPKTDMTLSELVTFLLIAKGETRDGGGITVTELKDKAEIALSSASRYMRSLSDTYTDRQGNAGHGLVTHLEDPVDGRRKILRASDKGHRLIEQIATTLLKGN
jgi:DNA-binding MarR family transcriptional regulator